MEETGKKTIRKEGKFTCYAAKAEALYPTVYTQRRINHAVSKTEDFVDLVCSEIEMNKVKVLRIHSSGDFYDMHYFHKWLTISQKLPEVIFFGYSKNFVAVNWLRDNVRPNFKLIYSWGGTWDSMAEKEKLPICYVAMGDEYNYLMPVIDSSKDAVLDYSYIMEGRSFAIRLH